MLEAERAAVLAAALARAGAEGWTWSVVERAAADAGFEPAMARRCFPAGLGDCFDALAARFDEGAAAAAAGDAFAGMSVRARIAALVRARLAVMAPHRDAVRRLVALAATPAWAGPAARRTLRTADVLWRLAGDTAVDFGYYTKRGLLAGIWGATLLCWLDDDSEGFAATHAFLDRRIAGVQRLGAARRRAARAFAALDAPLRDALRRAGSRFSAPAA